jgi:pilus assembly protein CpaF
LDISFSKYRLNAIHHSICRKNNEPCCSFALRISNTSTSLFDKDFMDDYVKDLLIELVKSNLSIVIGGKTSSGKTELQKFLISNAPTNCRIVVIDNVLELDQAHTTDIDLTFWQYDEQSNRITISNLIKNALRNNPDYLIVAESRGEEMVDVLNSAMTGHPIITTLHALSVNNMTSRMAEMVMMNDKKFDYRNVINNINRHLQVFVYTKIEKTSDGIKRFISDVNYHDENGNIHVLFTKNDQIGHYYKLPNELLSKINNSSLIEKFKES